jgi:GNAT superfamily N-acetyltransferase
MEVPELYELLFRTDWVLGDDNRLVQVHDLEILQLVDDEKETAVGQARVVLFHPNGDYQGMWQEADGESGQILDAVETFYGESGPLNPECDDYEGEDCRELLLLDSIRLEAPYRGHGLGLAICRALRRRFGPNIHTAILPSPEEHREGSDEDVAASRLHAYWKQLGYNREHGSYLWNNIAYLQSAEMEATYLLGGSPRR